LIAADRARLLVRLVGADPLVPQLRRLVFAARVPRWMWPPIKLLMHLSGRHKAVEDVNYFGADSAAAYWTACEEQFDYQMRWQKLMADQQLDVVLSPAAALPALKHDATVEVGFLGAYTCVYNLLGWPAGVVPITRVRTEEETATARTNDVRDRTARASELGSAGLPIAVQVAGRPWREDQVLSVMSALQA
jgi:fatty acid amide hydrolase